MTDFFDRYEMELRAAIATRAARPATPRRRRRTTRVVLLASVALAIALPAAAAVTGLWPQEEPDGLIRTAPKVTIASGSSPEFGVWEAFVSESDHGPCLGLRLADPPGPLPGSESEGCGEGGSRGRPAQITGGDGAKATALFGFAPAEATHVRAEYDGRQRESFNTYRHPARDGAFYFVSLAVRRDELRDLVLVPVGPDGDLAPISP